MYKFKTAHVLLRDGEYLCLETGDAARSIDSLKVKMLETLKGLDKYKLLPEVDPALWRTFVAAELVNDADSINSAEHGLEDYIRADHILIVTREINAD